MAEAPDDNGQSVRSDLITIVAYRADWPVSFERERVRVTAALRPWLVGAVEHIGSTSVPGLAAKPIIDMLARVTDYEDGVDAVPAMRSIGWTHAPEPDDLTLRTWSFCFPSVAFRTHHLHVVPEQSPRWATWLAFRDHLRNHPADAAQYARIKTALAEANNHDRPTYRSGKAPFIEDLLRRLTSG